MIAFMSQSVLAINPCDFFPAKSNVSEFNIKGDLQWYDDPFYDNRESANTGSIEANYARLRDEPGEMPSHGGYAYQFDGSGHAQFNFKRIQEFNLYGNGDYKRFVSENHHFVLGAGDFSASLDVNSGIMGEPFEVPTDLDITVGGGIGRFRDVTVLSKAIRIQNSFLDQGILLGPFTDEKLQEIAGILSEQGISLADRIQALESSIEETGLTAEENLGAKELLELEQIIEAQSEARLCGSELQASVGLSLNGIPPSHIRETLVLEGNITLVTDPVTQWAGVVRISTSLDFLSDYAIRSSLSLARRLSENLRIRAGYTFTRDPDRLNIGFTDRHQFSTTAFFQISNQISITLGGELIHETGYEEISRRISVQFNYDIF